MPNMIFSLVNVIESSIWTECLRNLDSVTLLVVLKKSSHDTWKSKGTSVQRVRKLNLPISILISEFQTVSLI